MTDTDKAGILAAALEKVRNICEKTQDHEGAIRQIHQMVGMAFGLVGIEAMPTEAEPERLNYCINLGPALQVEHHGGRLVAWVNDTELKIDAVSVAMANGEQARVTLEYQADAQGNYSSGGEAG